jgi:hypothetical protein
MFGDWLFSGNAFCHEAPDPAGRMPDGLDPLSRRTLGLLKMSAGEPRDLRASVIPAYLDAIMTNIDCHATA